MLPLILAAVGAYLIGDSVLEDKKYAKGGHTQGYDDKEDERLAMEHGKMSKKDLDSTHARRDDARFEERGKMAKGGKVVNEYKLVFKNDKGDYLSHYTEGVSIGDAYKVGKWREENTYGREGYKFIPSMTKLVANDIVSGTFEAGSDWMEDEFDEARPFKINKKMAKGGKLVGKQKKLDLNKNGKLDAEDFKMLRAKK